LWEGVWESNPHSNDTHFCESLSKIKETNFIKINSKIVRNKLVKNTIIIVILGTPSVNI
jgi:hypothetical protein